MQPEWIAEVTQKVKELESISRVEYVPVFARRSSSYKEFRSILSLAAITASVSAGYFLDVPQIVSLAFLVVGVALVQILLRIPRAARNLIPLKLRQEAVERAAREAFVEHEVFATRERSGVLVFVSEFEHGVYVIADKGLLPFVTENEWAHLGEELAEHMEKHSSGATLVKSLEQVSLRLAKHFPVKDLAGEAIDNPNELPDNLRKK